MGGWGSILKLIAQRIALGVLLLLAVSVLIFMGTEILPGDVASSILGQAATPQALENLRRELGLNEPAIVRYFTWLGGVLTGDLGVALSNGRDIADSIAPRLANTLFLAFWAAAVSVPLAILLGLVAVRYRNGIVDKTISGLALASTSLPEFFIGYVLIFIFAVTLNWLPSFSTVYDGMPFLQRMQAIALPAAALTLVVLAHMMRMTRAAILNVMQSAYIETAELKGLSQFDIIRRHALPTPSRRWSKRGHPEPSAFLVVGVGRRRGDLRLSRHEATYSWSTTCPKRDVPRGARAVGLIFAAVYIGHRI